MSASYYNKNALQLAEMYFSKSFEEVHQAWLVHLPAILSKKDARILDLGAGAGRDSKYLAKQGAINNIQITAVEPAQMLANLGQKNTHGLNVNWLQDSLPNITTVTKLEVSFDLILLSAVWMHIPDSQRSHSLCKLASLLKPGGKLVISLRHGPSGDERQMHDVSSDLLINRAKAFELSAVLVTNMNEDVIGREEVKWQTVVLVKGNSL